MADGAMRFEGDNCTLSFGLHTRQNRVQLLGTLWPRPVSGTAPLDAKPNVRFSTLFSETDLQSLQAWLLEGSDGELTLPEPLQAARRLSPPNSDPLSFEIQFHLSEVPVWWQWDTAFPLRVHLDVYQREFAFLVESLNRSYWFDT